MTEQLKDRIRAHQALVGTFLKTPSSIICEVLGRSELDLVCVDAEHAPFDRMALDQCLYALRSENMPALVRIPTAAPEHILNALDCGATGIVVPHVTNADQAEKIVAAAHFGAGGRGYAGSTRAAAYTGKPMAAHLIDSAAQTVVVAQIEDLEALDNLDALAAVEGIDCLFVGRIDLTVALGAASPTDPEVVAAVEKICAVSAAAGKPVGMFIGDHGEIEYWKQRGASLFLLSSDHGFLLQGARKLVADFHAIP